MTRDHIHTISLVAGVVAGASIAYTAVAWLRGNSIPEMITWVRAISVALFVILTAIELFVFGKKSQGK
ncbi:hypothetical protein A3A38_03975 [Candidatus Kaiserbacteria bacterium RIFCSPLOWO2_01_FULL_53_17]|uniref:Uncharacterized protein n=1 Tax=Candidatus Kaiserbacteria bacterium RIFCSPLOWO2_01_FULL_53_17 TaxID=1798511 RepID=A0A1F6EI20_9BACT|nr:MAG: hypothetical protein A3A38_03975 [Candidatus Kaiserbacteria bacterium RIFCSPLOWO2_01_FULL_53_17]